MIEETIQQKYFLSLFSQEHGIVGILCDRHHNITDTRHMFPIQTFATKEEADERIIVENERFRRLAFYYQKEKSIKYDDAVISIVNENKQFVQPLYDLICATHDVCENINDTIYEFFVCEYSLNGIFIHIPNKHTEFKRKEFKTVKDTSFFMRSPDNTICLSIKNEDYDKGIQQLAVYSTLNSIIDKINKQ